MAESPPTYEIRTVADFLKVPENRLGACLREFRIALRLARATDNLVRRVGEVIHQTDTVRCEMQLFRWIDDDKRTAHLRIRTKARPDGEGHDG